MAYVLLLVFIMFAMYDAYKFAEGENPRLSFFPFAFGAYFVTIGLMSPNHFRNIIWSYLASNVVFNSWIRNWIFYSLYIN
ncbi:hypothetical protein QFZ31_006797 [Neobacillus niacini]|nr:hypothetical protein [Neobacillus niacini]